MVVRLTIRARRLDSNMNPWRLTHRGPLARGCEQQVRAIRSGVHMGCEAVVDEGEKSLFLVLTIAKIRFWSLNSEIGQTSPSIFETAQI
jgi:hypothetical protein